MWELNVSLNNNNKSFYSNQLKLSQETYIKMLFIIKKRLDIFSVWNWFVKILIGLN
jgi:hypothetical protein